MYPENPEGTQVIVGSMNMGYISDTARNRIHNLFRLKQEPMPLGHSDGEIISFWKHSTTHRCLDLRPRRWHIPVDRRREMKRRCRVGILRSWNGSHRRSRCLEGQIKLISNWACILYNLYKYIQCQDLHVGYYKLNSLKKILIHIIFMKLFTRYMHQKSSKSLFRGNFRTTVSLIRVVVAVVVSIALPTGWNAMLTFGALWKHPHCIHSQNLWIMKGTMCVYEA